MMNDTSKFPMGMRTPCTAFKDSRLIASGELGQVVRKAKEHVDEDKNPVLIFDDGTSRLIEVDYRGPVEEVVKRLAFMVGEGVVETAPVEGAKPQGPGRPKLGVVAREVTLLPRHWEWLNAQPGGASVALRKLVEEARRANSGKDRVRQAQDACYRFMSVMAGDRPGYEEAIRALFAGSQERFSAMVEGWPPDVRDHAKKLAEMAFRSPVDD